eukprot:scaffold3074_cov280-Chaetoceros_neogracile.AAC.8
MKDFLESNNFSGDSDPIFSALPDDITTRRYVALHPELHQLHLFLLSREHDVENDVELNDDKVKQPFAKPRCGDFCADSFDLLWFECTLQKKEENQNQHVPLSLEDNDPLSTFGSEVSIDETRFQVDTQ